MHLLRARPITRTILKADASLRPLVLAKKLNIEHWSHYARLFNLYQRVGTVAPPPVVNPYADAAAYQKLYHDCFEAEDTPDLENSRFIAEMEALSSRKE